MRLVDRAGLPPAKREDLERQLSPLGMLQDVLRWSFARTPPCDVADVVIQDEYTHDVVIPLEAGVVLVLDCT